MFVNLLHILCLYIVVSFYLLQYIDSLVPTYLYKSVNKLQTTTYRFLKLNEPRQLSTFPPQLVDSKKTTENRTNNIFNT